jgi:hypothetical protein
MGSLCPSVLPFLDRDNVRQLFAFAHDSAVLHIDGFASCALAGRSSAQQSRFSHSFGSVLHAKRIRLQNGQQIPAVGKVPSVVATQHHWRNIAISLINPENMFRVALAAKAVLNS